MKPLPIAISALAGGALLGAGRAWDVRRSVLKADPQADWKTPAKDAAIRGFAVGAAVAGGVAAAVSYTHGRLMKSAAKELMELKEALGGRPDKIRLGGTPKSKNIQWVAARGKKATQKGLAEGWMNAPGWVRECIFRHGDKSGLTKLTTEQITELFDRYAQYLPGL